MERTLTAAIISSVVIIGIALFLAVIGMAKRGRKRKQRFREELDKITFKDKGDLAKDLLEEFFEIVQAAVEEKEAEGPLRKAFQAVLADGDIETFLLAVLRTLGISSPEKRVYLVMRVIRVPPFKAFDEDVGEDLMGKVKGMVMSSKAIKERRDLWSRRVGEVRTETPEEFIKEIRHVVDESLQGLTDREKLFVSIGYEEAELFKTSPTLCAVLLAGNFSADHLDDLTSLMDEIDEVNFTGLNKEEAVGLINYKEPRRQGLKSGAYSAKKKDRKEVVKSRIEKAVIRRYNYYVTLFYGLLNGVVIVSNRAVIQSGGAVERRPLSGKKREALLRCIRDVRESNRRIMRYKKFVKDHVDNEKNRWSLGDNYPYLLSIINVCCVVEPVPHVKRAIKGMCCLPALRAGPAQHPARQEQEAYEMEI